MSQEVQQVIRLLRLQPDAALELAIERFIALHGLPELITAASITGDEVGARRREDEIACREGKPRPELIKSPWAHCITTHREGVGRSGLLHLRLFVAENALRSNIDRLMTASTLGAQWYRDPSQYLPAKEAAWMLSKQTDEMLRVPGASASTFGIFASGTDFLGRMPFGALRTIVECNFNGPSSRLYSLVRKMADGRDYPPSDINGFLRTLNGVRNRVAHMHCVTRADYKNGVNSATALMVAMGFNAAKVHNLIVGTMGDLHVAERKTPAKPGNPGPGH